MSLTINDIKDTVITDQNYLKNYSIFLYEEIKTFFEKIINKYNFTDKEAFLTYLIYQMSQTSYLTDIKYLSNTSEFRTKIIVDRYLVSMMALIIIDVFSINDETFNWIKNNNEPRNDSERVSVLLVTSLRLLYIAYRENNLNVDSIVLNSVKEAAFSIVLKLPIFQSFVNSNFDERIIINDRVKPKLNSNSGCYIATFVYGSYECEKLFILRRFRDLTLSKFKLGRNFISYYYKKRNFFFPCRKKSS
jgi:hypothetical protein